MACRFSTECAWLCGVGLWLGAHGVASAQSVPGAEADAELRRGVALRKSGHDAEALEAFQHAYQLTPTPRALAQVALAEQALSLWLVAERDLNAALATTDDAWIRQNREALEGALRVVGSRLAWMTVSSNVDEAAVFWNGTRATRDSQQRVRVIAGEIVVEARAPGYLPFTRTLRIAPETTANVVVQLQLENTQAASAPPSTSKKPEVRESRSLQPWLGWGAIALGGVAAGIGAGFGVVAISKKSERDDDCATGCTQIGVDADRAGRRAGLASTVLLATGAIGIGTGVVLLLTAPSRREPPRAALSWRGTSLTLTGSF